MCKYTAALLAFLLLATPAIWLVSPPSAAQTPLPVPCECVCPPPGYVLTPTVVDPEASDAAQRALDAINAVEAVLAAP